MRIVPMCLSLTMLLSRCTMLLKLPIRLQLVLSIRYALMAMFMPVPLLMLLTTAVSLLKPCLYLAFPFVTALSSITTFGLSLNMWPRLLSTREYL